MRWHYEIRDLASLPRARGIEYPPCMAGPWWLRRIRRAAAGRDCCWHHGVNWRLVSETAIGIALRPGPAERHPRTPSTRSTWQPAAWPGTTRPGLSSCSDPAQASSSTTKTRPT